MSLRALARLNRKRELESLDTRGGGAWTADHSMTFVDRSQAQFRTSGVHNVLLTVVSLVIRQSRVAPRVGT